jgi:flagellar biosynthesis protein FliR
MDAPDGGDVRHPDVLDDLGPVTPAAVTFVLVLARVSSLIGILPLFSLMGIPRWVAPIVALAVSGLVTANLQPVPLADGILPLAMAAGAEVALGVSLGLGVAATFAALALGAEIMSAQTGLSFATLFDPFTKATESVLGTFASWMSGLVFVALGLPERCLEIVARSFALVPPGAAEPTAGAEALVDAAGQCLVLGVQLAGPIVAMVWVVHVFVALLSKLAPRMNAFFAVGTTATGVVGLAMLVVSLPWLLAIHGSAMSRAVDVLALQLSGP